jgi:hypothetical protein
VYGRSRGFKEEQVGVADAVNRWAGTGAVIPKEEPKPEPANRHCEYGVGGTEVPPEYT